MKKVTLFALLLQISVAVMSQSRETLLLDGWRFSKGAHAEASKSDYDDRQWQQVTIPHDWAISGPFDKDIDKQVVRIEQNGEREATEKTGRSGALPWIGEGWYRTEIELPDGYQRATLVFDGAMSEPTVYLDGQQVGYWAYGYNTFEVELPYTAGKHTLAVHLQNVEESSRWYPGAGLYRPVRLMLSQEIALRTFGTFARTTALRSVNSDATMAQEARMTVSADVVVPSGFGKKRKLRVTQTLVDADGKQVVQRTTECSDSRQATAVMDVQNATLWSPQHPYLYTLVTEVHEGDRLWDRRETRVGIRTVEYGPNGFLLNGRQEKFRGVCLHHDLGPLGAAFNKAAFRRQVALLQEMGCNAIRTSHNMPAPWQMDICDEMGMMVMAESCDMWIYAKCKNGYARFFPEWWERDFTNLVEVHRNHPSIVMWSIGNEIPDQGSATGLSYSRKIQSLVHQLDGTRPCTQGIDRPDAAVWSGVLQEMEVPGLNYRLHKYDMAYQNSPQGFLLGSETCSTVSSRGVYKFPAVEHPKGIAYDDGQCSSYDLDACSWSNLPDDDWSWQDNKDWLIGEFVWTGFDYLGEPTPYDSYWPSRSSYFGIFDLAGLPKDRVWLYRSHWAKDKETLHLLPHWTWPGREGEVTPVFCYTNYPEAELFVNGVSQGRIHKDPNAKNRLDRYRLRWMDVRYQPGELRVVAYDANGREAATEVVRTAGKPHHIVLSADRKDIEHTMVDEKGRALDCPDLCFVTATVVDKDGNPCPDADQQLQFSVSGAAQFRACCNGDATSTEVFTQPTMKAFHGQVVVVVEAGRQAGKATLTVKGKGLKQEKVNINIK